MVAKKSTAQTIIKQLKDGKSFKSLAKKYSLDTATKNKAAFKLKTGEVTSTPVKSQSGYHVIKMINHPAKGKFADHKKAIDNEIYASMAQDQATMKDVISTVLKRADVSIKDNDLKDVLASYVSTTSATK